MTETKHKYKEPERAEDNRLHPRLPEKTKCNLNKDQRKSIKTRDDTEREQLRQEVLAKDVEASATSEQQSDFFMPDSQLQDSDVI